MFIEVVKQPKPDAGKVIERIIRTASREVVVFCPKCKALETLHFAQGGLTPNQKFSQKGDRIYHACGSNEPCRLYSIT
jgi:hypothetical protein